MNVLGLSLAFAILALCLYGFVKLSIYLVRLSILSGKSSANLSIKISQSLASRSKSKETV